jgi:hypothetical protein
MEHGIAQIIPMLPDNYAQILIDSGKFQRWRGIKTPEDLMLLSLFHIVNGCTLKEVSTIAKEGKIAQISDVAFMERFAKCGEWFKEISAQLAPGLVTNYSKPEYLKKYRVIAADASDITEKSRSGRIFRLHHAIDIFTLNTVSYKITDQKTGEKLSNFTIKKDDLIIADRAYGTIQSMLYCLKNKSDFIFRLKTNCFTVYDETGEKIDLLSKLEHLDFENTTEFKGYVKNQEGEKTVLRICAKKKSKDACKNTAKKIRQKASKRQKELSNTAKKTNEYIVVMTSLPDKISAEDVLETYRYRWQIENYFKRLKSLMDFGELPKKRKDAIIAWLNGKLMVALVLELLISKLVFPPETK